MLSSEKSVTSNLICSLAEIVDYWCCLMQLWHLDSLLKLQELLCIVNCESYLVRNFRKSNKFRKALVNGEYFLPY